MRVKQGRRITIAVCGFALWFLQGCSARIPTYSWTTQEEALAVIRQRVDSIKTIQAACDITLTDPNGQSVTLDGALVARNPSWLRIRAWKFNSAVFDLTMTPDGLWVMQGDSPEVAERMPSELDPEQVSEAWNLLNGGFFEGDVTWAEESAPVILKPHITTLLSPARRPPPIRCVLEPQTLLPQRYSQAQTDREGQVYDIRLDHYRLINGIAFAHEIDMTSDAGRIVIRLRDVTLNEEPAPGAFKPPGRAVKQP